MDSDIIVPADIEKAEIFGEGETANLDKYMDVHVILRALLLP